eukprot:gene37845-29707_t
MLRRWRGRPRTAQWLTPGRSRHQPPHWRSRRALDPSACAVQRRWGGGAPRVGAGGLGHHHDGADGLEPLHVVDPGPPREAWRAPRAHERKQKEVHRKELRDKQRDVHRKEPRDKEREKDGAVPAVGGVHTLTGCDAIRIRVRRAACEASKARARKRRAAWLNRTQRHEGAAGAAPPPRRRLLQRAAHRHLHHQDDEEGRAPLPPDEPRQAAARDAEEREAEVQAARRVLTLQCFRHQGGGGAAAAAPRRDYVDLGARFPPPPRGPAPDWAALLQGEKDERGADFGLDEHALAALQYPARFTRMHAFEISPASAALWALVNGTSVAGTEVRFHHSAASVRDGAVYMTHHLHAAAADAVSMERVVDEEQCAVIRQRHREFDETRLAHAACERAAVRGHVRGHALGRCPSDWVVVKADLEGYEYAHHVDELFVETHSEPADGMCGNGHVQSSIGAGARRSQQRRRAEERTAGSDPVRHCVL